MTEISPLTDLRPERFDRPDILKRLTAASRKLAEFKGVAASMPNQGILISTLGLQEAKDSSAIENDVRDRGVWEDWVLYMLTAVEHTAAEGIATIQAIKALLLDYKHRIRNQYRFYSQDLINNLFSYPCTKIEFIQYDLKVSRLTATKYLDTLAASGFLRKRKNGRSNYYLNLPLYDILTGKDMVEGEA